MVPLHNLGGKLLHISLDETSKSRDISFLAPIFGLLDAFQQADVKAGHTRFFGTKVDELSKDLKDIGRELGNLIL